MPRPVGSKNFNRKRLQEALEEHNIDFIKDYYGMITAADTPVAIKASMLMNIMEFIYPKRRAEDSGGTPDQGAGILILTHEERALLVKVARGDK